MRRLEPTTLPLQVQRPTQPCQAVHISCDRIRTTWAPKRYANDSIPHRTITYVLAGVASFASRLFAQSLLRRIVLNYLLKTLHHCRTFCVTRPFVIIAPLALVPLRRSLTF